MRGAWAAARRRRCAWGDKCSNAISVRLQFHLLPFTCYPCCAPAAGGMKLRALWRALHFSRSLRGTHHAAIYQFNSRVNQPQPERDRTHQLMMTSSSGANGVKSTSGPSLSLIPRNLLLATCRPVPDVPTAATTPAICHPAFLVCQVAVGIAAVCAYRCPCL